MAVSLDLGARGLTAGNWRTFALASLGGALEFYDFVIFVYFTGVLGKLFFPADLPDWLRQFQTLGIFAAGYLARPLGGIVMAHIGDLRGRKRMFTLSVLLMAIPTFVIGLAPTYQSIGPAAPLLLLMMRVLQGAAIGGEAPGGWVFVAEHAGRERIGLAVGLLTSGLTAGLLLGSLVATSFNLLLTSEQIAGGFWRLPFLLGGVAGFAAMSLRRRLAETPVFEELRRRAATSKDIPLRTVLREHRSAVALSMASAWTLTAIIVVLILMTPSLLQTSFHLSPRDTLLANLAGTGTLCLSTIVVGVLFDRFGPRRTGVPMTVLLIASTYALYVCAEQMPSAIVSLYVMVGAAAGVVVLTPIVMVRAFPAAVRFSGFSFSYNVAFALFGGVTPLLVAWLSHLEPLAPAHYIAIVALIGMLAILFTPTAGSTSS